MDKNSGPSGFLGMKMYPVLSQQGFKMICLLLAIFYQPVNSESELFTMNNSDRILPTIEDSPISLLDDSDVDSESPISLLDDSDVDSESPISLLDDSDVDSESPISLLDDSDLDADSIIDHGSSSLPTPTDDFSRPVDVEADLCLPSNKTQISRDRKDCGVFLEICFKNRSINSTASELHRVEVARPCETGLMFDVVEMKCLPPELVDCTMTEFFCPGNDAYVADTKRPSWFIECHNDTGERSRRECQPHGTVFDSETHSCVKPPFTEPFLIATLRAFVRFLVQTRYTMSPWIEVVPVNGSSNSTHNNSFREDGNLVDDDNEQDSDAEEDRVEVFTSNTAFIVLYYCVIAGIPLLFILFFFLITYTIFKICWKPDDSKELDFTDEFYRYDPADSYVSTRM